MHAIKNATAKLALKGYCIFANLNKEERVMGIMDDLKGKSKDIMDDPDKKAQVEQMAKDKGISVEDAKKHFEKKNEG
jgi:tRNA(Ser,Leu) C12 N-acetylase TAN1